MTEQDDDELLLDLLMRWDELRRRGQLVSAAELCRTRPDLCEQLTKRIAALQATSWLEQPLGDEDPPPEADPPLTTSREPKVFSGRYRLDSIIAEGGFAQVWKGTDLELQRTVAIKIPKPSRLESTDTFIAEAKRVARLKHDRIVPVFDVGRENGTYFIVSEYVEGGSLKTHLAKGPLSSDQAVQWLTDIADALQYAHQQGIIHRDIKPANILIDHHGRAQLADFGIAQSPLKAAKSIGTIKYMSPEQLAGEPADARADVFSLGVVLHEALTGDLPYPATTLPGMPARIEPGIPKTIAAGVPRNLRAVCDKALQPDPEKRYATASEFRDALQADRPSGRLSAGILIATGIASFLAVGAWAVPRLPSVLRPTQKVAELRDWRENGNHFTETLGAISKSLSDAKPTVRFLATHDQQHEYHGGGVAAPNGLVYCMPSSLGHFGVIDPALGNVRTLPCPVAQGAGLFFGAVLAPNGCVYGIPHGATTFVKIDPRSESISTFGTAPGNGCYWGGCVADDGLIYCVPCSSNTVAVIDPATDTATTFGAVEDAAYKYSGGVLAPNGKIYCMPDHARRVMVIDPAEKVIAYLDHDLGEGAGKCFGGVLALNGKIYSGLCSTGSILIIDPQADTVSSIDGLPASRYVGGVLGPDGKIYVIPHERGPVMVLDTESNKVTPLPQPSTGAKYWGAVLTPYGSIIAIPWETTSFMAIDFGARLPDNWALNRLFNRY